MEKAKAAQSQGHPGTVFPESPSTMRCDAGRAPPERPGEKMVEEVEDMKIC